MSSSLDILIRKNPTITDAWDGKSYGNTESTQGAYDAVLFNETYNGTIQECKFAALMNILAFLMYLFHLSLLFVFWMPWERYSCCCGVCFGPMPLKSALIPVLQLDSLTIPIPDH